MQKQNKRKRKSDCLSWFNSRHSGACKITLSDYLCGITYRGACKCVQLLIIFSINLVCAYVPVHMCKCVLLQMHACLFLAGFRSQEAVQPLYCHYGNKRLAVRPLKSLSLFRELQPFQPNSGLPVGAVMDICGGLVAALQSMCVLIQQPGAPLFLSPSSGLIKFAPIYSYALIRISSSAESVVLSVTSTHVCKKIKDMCISQSIKMLGGWRHETALHENI